VVTYLCSTGYAPEREHTIAPFDPAIGIEWPDTDLDGNPLGYLLSDRDRDAQSLAEAEARGLLDLRP
jgi:dTDP-4-dehydrorhamnose 3,5-epimerase